MRVLCIDASLGKNYSEKPKFKEGDIVDALKTSQEDFLHILQNPINSITGRRCNWSASRFIPLSDIDEKELSEEREMYKEFTI